MRDGPLALKRENVLMPGLSRLLNRRIEGSPNFRRSPLTLVSASLSRNDPTAGGKMVCGRYAKFDTVVGN